MRVEKFELAVMSNIDDEALSPKLGANSSKSPDEFEEKLPQVPVRKYWDTRKTGKSKEDACTISEGRLELEQIEYDI